MKRKFVLSVRSYSVNKLYYRDQRFKRQETYEWMAQVFNQLSLQEHQDNLKALKDFFDPKKHCLQFQIVEYYTAEKFTASNGEISSKTFDISNIEKPLIDLFCDSKYYDEPHPYGCKNLSINDKFVTELYSSKRLGNFPRLEVSIKIKSRRV